MSQIGKAVKHNDPNMNGYYLALSEQELIMPGQDFAIRIELPEDAESATISGSIGYPRDNDTMIGWTGVAFNHKEHGVDCGVGVIRLVDGKLVAELNFGNRSSQIRFVSAGAIYKSNNPNYETKDIKSYTVGRIN